MYKEVLESAQRLAVDIVAGSSKLYRVLREGFSEEVAFENLEEAALPRTWKENSYQMTK